MGSNKRLITRWGKGYKMGIKMKFRTPLIWFTMIMPKYSFFHLLFLYFSSNKSLLNGHSFISFVLATFKNNIIIYLESKIHQNKWYLNLFLSMFCFNLNLYLLSRNICQAHKHVLLHWKNRNPCPVHFFKIFKYNDSKWFSEPLDVLRNPITTTISNFSHWFFTDPDIFMKDRESFDVYFTWVPKSRSKSSIPSR